MGNRLSKIYTRTGDDGSTGLGDGTRVPKESLRVEAYGTVDEANSALGMVLAVPGLPDAVRQCLTEVQHDLFDVGAELCVPGYRVVEAAWIERLEQVLDGFNDGLPPLKEFILPAGTRSAALAHVGRTVARRAERAVVALAAAEPVNAAPRQYLNRLSDLMFVLARVLNRMHGGDDVYWKSERMQQQGGGT